MFLEMQSFSVTKRQTRIFPEWIKLWCVSLSSKLTYQIKLALVTTLRAQADFIYKLIDDGYEFVKIA